MQTSKSAEALSPAVTQEATPAQLAAQVKLLEDKYVKATGIQERTELIYDLVSVDSPDRVDAVGRLFSGETNQKLKMELINALGNIEGDNKKKLDILTGGIAGKQSNAVRIKAIVALMDLGDKRGVPLLRGLLNDSDRLVRQNAEDAVEQLQADLRLRAPQLYQVQKPMETME
ncbi:MAG: HEAT repeat domain-containing protein [Victivallales bacterium]|jgi:HEAT repeat protein